MAMASCTGELASAMASSSSFVSSSKLHFLLVPLPEHGHINPMLCFASQLAALGCIVTFVKAEKAPLQSAQSVLHLEDATAEKDLPSREASLNGLVKASPVAQDALQESNYDRTSAEKGRPKDQTCLLEANHGATNGSTSLNGSHAQCASNGENVQFWTLPHVRGPSPLTEGNSRFEILRLTLASLEEQQGMVEKLVQESKASDAPIACIICDILLCSWVMNVAKRQAIPAAALVPTAGVNFYMPYLTKVGKCDESNKLRQRFALPEMKGPTSSEDIKKMAEVRKVFFKAFDCVEEASHVLVNSFKHLESALLESLKATDLHFKFVGPCLPAWEAGDMVENNMAKQAGCLYTPDHTCLPWLDRQEKGSVLFVSFGSEVCLEEEQVQELALGIEASGHKFLWVVRPDMPSHNLPQEDFRRRTSNIGMFVSWAPQRRVLQHSAVGAFLTHCGWNSTLESMMFGVPMLCLPLNGDQFLNAQLIEVHWKVGVPLRPPHTVVQRAVVERAVRDVMRSGNIRERIARLKEVAQTAISESQISTASFVQDIANNKAHQKHSASLQ